MLFNKPSVRFVHLHVAKNGIKHERPWLGHYLVNKK